MKRLWSDTLEISVGEVDGYPCIRLRGEADEAGAHALEGVLRGMERAGRGLILVDTRDLRFLDLTCCTVLKALADRLVAAGGSLVIVDSALPLERVLKLMDLDGYVPIAPTLAHALAHLEDVE